LSDRLLHAGVTIADEQRAHGFYREALGFGEIWRGGRPEGVIQWVNMRVPDGTDYLEYMLITAPPDRRQRGVLHHLCLRVDDIQEAWEEVGRRTSVGERSVPNAPQIGVNGRYQLNLFDPDGTRVELMEPFRAR
jgi:lactoylglutathione lyase